MARIAYLTGVSNPTVRAVAHQYGIGLLVTPDCSYRQQIAQFPCFAVDNGMYGLAKRHQEDKFDADSFFGWLDTLPRTALFVAVPDVLHFVQLPGLDKEVPVGDAPATLAQFPVYARRIRAMGFKAALVGQDGVEELLHEIRWDLVDAIFLGGSTEWKLGAGARALIVEAKRRRVHVHMGRVNSYKRLQLAQDMGCDTADGTYLAFAGRKGADYAVSRVIAWHMKLTDRLELTPTKEPEPMRVYLAGPINGCTDDEAKGWRDYVSELLVAEGVEVFDPMVRDYRGRELEPGIAAKIVEQDKDDILDVDTVLVCYEKPSVGTSMETLFAWQSRKGVIVVNKSGKPLSPWLLYHSDIQVETLEEAVLQIVADARHPRPVRTT